jgi:SAM-dependent methyltransferase
MGRSAVAVDVGKVETPPSLALHMVGKLFGGGSPPVGSRVLDAGCGRGAFVEALLSYLRSRGGALPEIVCAEKDGALAEVARRRFGGVARVVVGDLLLMGVEELGGPFDFVISNPPYVSYERISPELRATYRRLFSVASGRFDLYMLFFEKALSLLRPGGRLVFVTPEKYLYVQSAEALRRLLAGYAVEELEFVDERAFGDVLAYPLITVMRKAQPSGPTSVTLRDGRRVEVQLPRDGAPWLPAILAGEAPRGGCVKLGLLAERVSAGVATGRDEVFVVPREAVPQGLRVFAYPTVSGRELSSFTPGGELDYAKLRHVMLVPYGRDGGLLDEGRAGPLLAYLSRFRRALEERYAVLREGKPWYAFHEDPPMPQLLRPKILWPDVAKTPVFYVDAAGLAVPRHSVYYLVPRDQRLLRPLVEFLNGEAVGRWIAAHAQRAANGYLRLQSHVIRELCVPKDMLKTVNAAPWT